MLSSKLVVEINCEELRENNPEIFKGCGWNSCKKIPFDIFEKVPKKEYLLWIPTALSPMSIVEFLKSHYCFSNLNVPEFDLKKPDDQILYAKKGIKIKIYGFTKETKKYNDCGLEAI